MDTQITKTQEQIDPQIMERVLISGDLSKLTDAQRVMYYIKVCESIGVNPLTRPFEYITLNGKLTLYPKRDCTDQLRDKNKIGVTKTEHKQIGDVYTVTVYVQDATGRTDCSIGAVYIAGLKGNDLSNAMMKAETKAKRRATLSICSLGWADEVEVDTIANRRPAWVTDEGEIIETENQNQETGQQEPAIELINPMGKWAVELAAEQWNIGNEKAAKEIAKLNLGKKIDKKEFIDIVNGAARGEK